MPRTRRSIPEINAGSMADIAFLLLIFFLVTTSIDGDKGIAIKLPPKLPKNQSPPVINQRNVLEVLINDQDELLVENEWIKIEQLCAITKEFILNPNQRIDYSESPQLAVISLKNDRSSSFGAYILVQNELKRAYNELRDEMSLKLYGKHFKDLIKGSSEDQNILDKYPQKISEAEPENISQENQYK